jgi:FkbM family methyltransferase
MKFNDTRFARDYECRMAAEGYPGALLDAVARELAGLERVIDIGAGTGFFALHLARLGHLVTAVEPSEEMVRIFREKLDDDTAGRIAILNSSWEQWRGRRHDGALCAHSIYGIKETESALEKMKSLAGKTVLLVRNDSESVTLSGLIKARLGNSSCAKDFTSRITSALDNLGISYSSETLVQKRITSFTDPDAEAEYFADHTGAGAEKAGVIAAILREHVTRDGNGFRFENVYSDRMILF